MLADSSESSQESGKENSILAESKVSCRNITRSRQFEIYAKSFRNCLSIIQELQSIINRKRVKDIRKIVYTSRINDVRAKKRIKFPYRFFLLP